jgi:hypothetical protein
MPKKSRHAKAKRRARVAKAAQEERLQQLRPMSGELGPSTRVSPKVPDLTTRYQYVMPEIKRIGIMAGAIIVVLVILSFVFR